MSELFYQLQVQRQDGDWSVLTPPRLSYDEAVADARSLGAATATNSHTRNAVLKEGFRISTVDKVGRPARIKVRQASIPELYKQGVSRTLAPSTDYVDRAAKQIKETTEAMLRVHLERFPDVPVTDLQLRYENNGEKGITIWLVRKSPPTR